MIKATCVDKFRDRSEKIIGYRLQDATGVAQDIKSDDLKKMIKSGKIEVNNLTLTSDNRLITSDAKLCITDYDNVKRDRPWADEEAHGDPKELLADKGAYMLETIRDRGEHSELYRKYQPMLSLIDVDIVGAFYLSIPSDKDTLESVMNRSINRLPSYETRRVKIESAQDILNNPSILLGVFMSNDYKPTLEYDNGDCMFGTDASLKIPVLLLHRNSELRLVMLGEMRYTNKTLNLKDSLAIVTIDSAKKVHLTDVGKHISKREQYLLAKNIVNSKIDYWIGTEATRKLVDKADKKQLRNNLRSAGVTALTIPFSIVLVLACIPQALFQEFGRFVDYENSMTLDEKMVQAHGGYIAGKLYKEAKESQK